MRITMGALGVCAALIATAGGAQARSGAGYDGSFTDIDAPVSIATKLKGVTPRKVTGLRYQNLPVACEQTGQNTFDTTGDGATLPAGGIKIDQQTHRFQATWSYGDPGSTTGSEVFTGKFSRNWHKVTGTYQASVHFVADQSGPEETCTSDTLPYKARATFST